MSQIDDLWTVHSAMWQGVHLVRLEDQSQVLIQHILRAHQDFRRATLPDGLMLVTQNLRKSNRWTQLCKQGHRVTWLGRGGPFTGLIQEGLDGQTEFFQLPQPKKIAVRSKATAA